MSSLDLALGDLISANRTSKGPRRGGGGGGNRDSNSSSAGSGPIRHNRGRRDERRDNRSDQQYGRSSAGGAGRSEGQWNRDLGSSHQAAASVQRIVGDTVRVSNLDSKMTEEDLRFVFEKIGPLVSANINYTASGECTGTAEVRFSTQTAAAQAVVELDQAEVDGRLMYVQLIGQVMQSSHEYPSVRRRDDRGDSNRRGGGNDRDRSRGRDSRDNNRPRDNNNRNGGDRQQRGGRGGGSKPQGRGGRGGARSEPRPSTSMEDLDAELNSYHQSRSAAASSGDAAAAAPTASEATPITE